MELHKDRIAELGKSLASETTESFLQNLFAELVSDALMGFNPTVQAAVRPEGVVKVVSIPICEDALLVLVPNMTVRTPPGAGEMAAGRMSVGFRLSTQDAIRSPVFVRERQIMCHLQLLLPSEFNDYGIFESKAEFLLNAFAWTEASRLIVGEAMDLWRG